MPACEAKEQGGVSFC